MTSLAGRKKNITAGGMGEGAVLEVRFADGVWYRGRLVERIEKSKLLRWRVQFDDGELRDIQLANPEALVRFDAGAYGATVEVRCEGEWHRGRLVELMRGGEHWGVAFEDGGWAEDVRLGDPDVRYVFAGGGAGRRGERGRMEEDETGKRVRTETGGGGGRAEEPSQVEEAGRLVPHGLRRRRRRRRASMRRNHSRRGAWAGLAG